MVVTTDPRRSQPRLVKEGLSSFQRQQKQKVKARRQAEKIRRRGGSARAETFGKETRLIIVKEPELFTEEGKKAKPDSKGIIRGFSRADLVKKKALEQTKRKQLTEFKKTETRKIIRGVITPTFIQSRIPKKEFKTISKQKIIGRIEAAPKRDILERTKRKLLGVTQRQIGSERKSASKAIAAGVALGAVGFAEGLKDVGVLAVNIAKSPRQTGRNIGEGLKTLAKNPRGTLETFGKDFTINPTGVIGEFLGFQAGINLVGKGIVKSPIGKAIAKEKFIKAQPKKVQPQIRKILKDLTDTRINNIIKETKKLPAAQRQAIINNLESLKAQNKLTKKALKGKEVGIVTKTDKQLVSKSLKQGIKGKVGKTDIVTLSDNKLFIVNKKNVPKVSKKTFDVEVVTVSRGKQRGLDVTRANTQTFKAKFNPKTGTIDIVSKGRELKNLSPKEALNMITRLKPGAKSLIDIKKTVVKPTIRKVVSKKKLKITPVIKVVRGKVKKGFEVKALTKDVKVKGFERKIKKVKAVKRVSKKVTEKGVFAKGEALSLSELKIKPKGKKVKGSKLSSIIKKSNPNAIFALDLKTGTGFKLTTKQVSKIKEVAPSIVTRVKKASPISVDNGKIGLFTPRGIPIKKLNGKPKAVVSRAIKEQIRKPRKKPITKGRFLPVIKQIRRTKPSIKPVSKPKKKPSIKPSIKPIIKPQIKPVSKPISKVDVKRIQQQKKIRALRLKLKLKPPVKPKIIPFIKEKKVKKKIKSKVSKKKPVVLSFTPTLATAPKKKTVSKKGLKEDELVLFTGLEFRG